MNKNDKLNKMKKLKTSKTCGYNYNNAELYHKIKHHVYKKMEKYGLGDRLDLLSEIMEPPKDDPGNLRKIMDLSDPNEDD